MLLFWSFQFAPLATLTFSNNYIRSAAIDLWNFLFYCSVSHNHRSAVIIAFSLPQQPGWLWFFLFCFFCSFFCSWEKKKLIKRENLLHQKEEQDTFPVTWREGESLRAHCDLCTGHKKTDLVLLPCWLGTRDTGAKQSEKGKTKLWLPPEGWLCICHTRI